MRWILYNILFAIAYAAMMPKFLLRMKKRAATAPTSPSASAATTP